jgi:hypothetical protein
LYHIGHGCSPAAAAAPTTTSANRSSNRTDAVGKQVTLPSPAQRIISLAPANQRSRSGASQVIGRDTTSDYPEQVKSITDIGGGFGEINLEAILAQNPDLVIASTLTPSEQTKALEDAGLTVFTLGNPNNFGCLQTCKRWQLTGHSRCRDSVEELNMRRRRKNWAIPANAHWCFTTDGTDPNAARHLAGNFIDTLIKMAGGDNFRATRRVARSALKSDRPGSHLIH